MGCVWSAYKLMATRCLCAINAVSAVYRRNNRDWEQTSVECCTWLSRKLKWHRLKRPPVLYRLGMTWATPVFIHQSGKRSPDATEVRDISDAVQDLGGWCWPINSWTAGMGCVSSAYKLMATRCLCAINAVSAVYRRNNRDWEQTSVECCTW